MRRGGAPDRPAGPGLHVPGTPGHRLWSPILLAQSTMVFRKASPLARAWQKVKDAGHRSRKTTAPGQGSAAHFCLRVVKRPSVRHRPPGLAAAAWLAAVLLTQAGAPGSPETSSRLRLWTSFPGTRSSTLEAARSSFHQPPECPSRHAPLPPSAARTLA